MSHSTQLYKLTNLQSRRPIIFIGHSLGGIVIKKVELSDLSMITNIWLVTY